MCYKLITDINDIDTACIKIKKPYNLYHRHVFDIFYGDENNQFLIQTPDVMMSFGYQISTNNSISMDIVFRNYNFVKTLKNTLESVDAKLQRKYSDILENKSPFHVVFENRARLKNSDVNTVGVFDGNNNKINIDNISRDDKILTIFQVEKVVVYDKFYTFYLKLIQLKKAVSPIAQCLFGHPNSIPRVPLVTSVPPVPPVPPPLPQGIHDEQTCDMPEKYKKMLAMGVPLPAVKQKMMMDGISDNVSNTKPKPETIMVTRKVPSLDEIVGALKNLKNVKTNIQ